MAKLSTLYRNSQTLNLEDAPVESQVLSKAGDTCEWKSDTANAAH